MPATPVTSPITDEMRRLVFGYDRSLPLDPVESTSGLAGRLSRTEFNIQGTNGQRIPGTVWRRADGGVQPLVILQHGGGAGAHRHEAYVTGPAQRWAEEEGWAAIAIDAPGHGERAKGASDVDRLFGNPHNWRELAIQLSQDLMRALDYAETKPDLDLTRVGYVGFSMGTILGVSFVALDKRVSAAVFAIGGAWTPPALRKLKGPAADEAALVGDLVGCRHFAPLVAPRPVLMINGRQDEVVSSDDAECLFDAFGQPKRIEWYEGGHAEMRGAQFKQMRDFLRETLA